jgi:serine/threonine-protein kinase
VVRTDPGAGTAVGRGDTIKLQIATAATQLTVPDVTGDSKEAAVQALKAAGFTNVNPQGGSDGPTPGTVVSTDPPAGTKAAPGDEIIVHFVG